jgi:glyoxylate reductase
VSKSPPLFQYPAVKAGGRGTPQLRSFPFQEFEFRAALRTQKAKITLLISSSKPPRIFATADIGDAAFARLRQRGYEVEVYSHPEAPPKSLIVEKVRSGIDGLISTLRDQIDAEVFAAGEGTLKCVAQYAVGVDNIDRAAANHFKIRFTNTPDVLTEATAEFACFALADLARRLWLAEKLVRENRWGFWHPYLPFLGDEITGKTIAVIGAGRIGQAMAKKCTGFDMNILLYPQRQDESFLTALQSVMDLRYRSGLQRDRTTIRYATLEDALREADFVSIHVPLVREGEGKNPTYHLFNETTLRWMKPTAYLVNTARGAVIDEAALVRALKENWIAGAALDVYATEPLPSDSPLRDPKLEDRLRLYPHIGSGGRITRLSVDPNGGMAGRCIQGLIDVLEGSYGGDVQKMPYVVNKEGFR